MDSATGCFYIVDGNESKASTNGTWFRLSGPQQESPFFVIEHKIELLIGIVLRYIFIYIYIYICIYIYKYTLKYIYIYMHTYIYVYIHTYTYVYI
jgi:hypothetical protein